jgi:hypothetical protein
VRRLAQLVLWCSLVLGLPNSVARRVSEGCGASQPHPSLTRRAIMNCHPPQDLVAIKQEESNHCGFPVTSSPPSNKNDLSRPPAGRRPLLRRGRGGMGLPSPPWRKSCVAPRSIPRFECRSGRGHAGGRTEIWMSPKSCVTPPAIPRFARRSDKKLRKTGRSTIREGDNWPNAQDLSAKCKNVSRETFSAESGIVVRWQMRSENQTASGQSRTNPQRTVLYTRHSGKIP